MTTSTPEALWASPAAAVLQPASVTCHGLRYSVDGREVLDSVDLAVPLGARVLLTERSGYATAVLLRILSGLVRAHGGSATVAGLAVGEGSSWRRHVGYVPGELPLYHWLTGREALELGARLHGVAAGQVAARVDEVNGRLELGEALELPLGSHVPAQRQLLALAAGILHDPEVLLLDEPLRSLDPTERDFRLATATEGRTVLLRSRHPARERDVCDRVAFFSAGRVSVEANLDELATEGIPLSISGLEAYEARSPR